MLPLHDLSHILKKNQNYFDETFLYYLYLLLHQNTQAGIIITESITFEKMILMLLNSILKLSLLVFLQTAFLTLK